MIFSKYYYLWANGVVDRHMEMVDILSYIILLFSLGIFYGFGKFTKKLIKQHYDIYGLLYDMEKNRYQNVRYISARELWL